MAKSKNKKLRLEDFRARVEEALNQLENARTYIGDVEEGINNAYQMLDEMEALIDGEK